MGAAATIHDSGLSTSEKTIMKVIPILVISIIFYSCQKDHDTNCTAAKSTFTWQKDRSLEQTNTLIEGDTINFMTIHEGDDLLFTWQYDGEECRDREDDDYTRYFRFLVPAGVSSFSYTNEKLTERSAHYTVSGWWVNSGATQVRRGTISGTKLNAFQWKVEMDIYLDEPYGSDHFVFEKTFSLK